MGISHTPGPWHVVPYGDGDSLVVCSDTDGEWRICFMATHGGTESVWDAIQANARLIAAAPDMLAALEAEEAARTAFDGADEHHHRAEAEGWLNDPTGSGWVAQSYDYANRMAEKASDLRRAAISKATSRQPEGEQ